MTASNELLAPVAVLKAPRAKKELIIYARAVYGSLLDNPSFPSPSPPLSTFAEDIAAFEDAETKAATKAKGAATFRDATKKTVVDDLNQYRAYVQSVVSKDISPAAAAAKIESAFMSVRKAPRRSIPEVSAKNADVSGKVVLAAKAVAPVAVYVWEYSVDQAKWTPLPETLKSRTEVSGLTPACVYYFRFRAVTRAGKQDYSQIVSLVVR